MCHLNTARHSGLSERLSRSSLLSSSSLRETAGEREGGLKLWRINEQLSPAEDICTLTQVVPFSAKSSLFPANVEVLKGGREEGADWFEGTL